MFIHPGRLPFQLPTASYSSAEASAKERERLFAPRWLFAGTRADLPRPGSFVTRDLLGTPVLLWNVAGEPRAFLNVCAHRHAMLTCAPSGTCAELRCQYHGWSYDGRGYAVRIPDGASFAPLQPKEHRLQPLRLETCGSLLFVALAGGSSLREELGATYERFASATGDAWEPIDAWERRHACNWKVVVENTLESYHLPAVHAATFGTPPDAASITHELAAEWTSFTTPDERPWLARHHRRVPTDLYTHVHVFPSLLVSLSDAYTVVHSVLPEGPATSVSTWRVFLQRAETSWLGRLMRPLVRAQLRRTSRQVDAEDAQIYSAVQRGLEHSPHPGILSAREERLWAFHSWVAATTR